jgi:hypothetical protein
MYIRLRLFYRDRLSFPHRVELQYTPTLTKAVASLHVPGIGDVNYFIHKMIDFGVIIDLIWQK